MQITCIMKSVPVVIFVRVSSSIQETSRQISDLQSYAESKNYEVVEVIEEKITGRASDDARSGLRKLEAMAESGSIKKILCAEISRLARRNSVLHKFCERMEELGVSIFWHSQNTETLLPDGRPNPASRFLLAILGEMGRAEIEQMSLRVRSGQAEAVRKGIKLGRKVGSTTPRDQFLKKHCDIVRLLRQGLSIRQTAAVVKKGISTVARVKASMEPELALVS